MTKIKPEIYYATLPKNLRIYVSKATTLTYLIDIINTATYCEFMRITVFHFDEKNKCEDVSSIKLIFQEVPLCILVLQSTYQAVVCSLSSKIYIGYKKKYNNNNFKVYKSNFDQVSVTGLCITQNNK